MRAQSASQTVLFADISESTRLYDALGNEAGRLLLLECLALMRQVIERAEGTVVDRIGDELLCTFPDPARAGRASCELHRAIEAANAGFPATLSIRIGFHHGPLLVDGDRIFGDTVHIAKRVATLAKPQQTLITGQARALIPVQERLATRFVDHTHLKGKLEAFELFEIVWDMGAATDMAPQPGPTTGRSEPTRVLLLNCEGRVYALDSTHPTLTIGRDQRVDVVIDHPSVSRFHARIEYRNGSLVFVDTSTNGSQVSDEHGVPRFLRRDEHHLVGEGSIKLGPEKTSPSLDYRLRWRDETTR